MSKGATMGKELERLLQSVCEVVLEDERLLEALAAQQYRPTEESERLKLILVNAIEDFRRFYIRRSIAEERTLSVKQVAARYNLSEQWVTHCEGLQAIAFKVGKFLRYRESDLENFEKARAKNQQDRPQRGYHLQTVMRHATETDGNMTNRIKFITKETGNG